MLRIKRYYTALDRYRRSKGYGIHSPFAFRFVLKVLRERSGYYAYQTIRDGRNLALVRMVEEGISSRKVLSNKNARLIFRVVNFFNPTAIIQFGSNYGVSAICALSASSKSQLWLLEPKAREYSIVKDVVQGNSARIHAFGNVDDCISNYLQVVERPFVIVNAVAADNLPAVAQFLQTVVGRNGVIVMRNMASSSEVYNLWSGVVRSMEYGMSFTNGKIGVIVANRKLPLQQFSLWF